MFQNQILLVSEAEHVWIHYKLCEVMDNMDHLSVKRKNNYDWILFSEELKAI